MASSGTRGGCEAARAARAWGRAKHARAAEVGLGTPALFRALSWHELRRGQVGRAERTAASWAVGWGGVAVSGPLRPAPSAQRPYLADRRLCGHPFLMWTSVSDVDIRATPAPERLLHGKHVWLTVRQISPKRQTVRKRLVLFAVLAKRLQTN